MRVWLQRVKVHKYQDATGAALEHFFVEILGIEPELSPRHILEVPSLLAACREQTSLGAQFTVANMARQRGRKRQVSQKADEAHATGLCCHGST